MIAHTKCEVRSVSHS